MTTPDHKAETHAASTDENPEFSAWVRSLPPKHWAMHDLTAAREGWEAALARRPSPAPDNGGEGEAAPWRWRCFHCGDVFTDEYSARLHFGSNEDRLPACKIKGSEHGLIEALRRAENDAAEAWNAIHAETTDSAKVYYAQHTRHQEQLRAAEQIGYDRGIADAKAHPEELGLCAHRSTFSVGVEANGWRPE